VGTLLGMPSARGLFARAIPQSGAAHNVHSRETATNVAAHFLEELGLSPSDAPGKLREVPPDKLLDSHQQTILKLGASVGLLPFQPLVDEESLPEPPLAGIRAGCAADVALLTGTTRDEWKLFGILDGRIRKLDEARLVRRLSKQLPGADVEALVETYRSTREGRAFTEPYELFCAIETDRVFRLPAIRLAEAQSAHQPASPHTSPPPSSTSSPGSRPPSAALSGRATRSTCPSCSACSTRRAPSSSRAEGPRRTSSRSA
jgi:para-nitrobenzyl esterase